MSGSLLWIHSTVTNVLVRDHLRMQLEFPHYFNKDFPATPCWFVVGRPGLRKHEAVRQAILDAKLPCQVCPMEISLDHEKHGKCMEHVRKILEAAEANPQATFVIVINQGHLLCQSQFPGVVEEFNAWPGMLRQKHPNVVVVICCDITVRELPQPTKIAYQYQQQVFFPSPDEEWRAMFFRKRFAEYAAFIADKPRIHVSVSLDDDMFETLVESSAYATVEELEGFVNKVIRPTHKVDREPLVVINEEYCCRFMVDKGGVYSLSEADGYAQEQAFIMSAGIQGIPPLRERTARTITNQELYDNGGVERNGKKKPETPHAGSARVKQQMEEEDNESKLHDWGGQRITFDKDGKEVVLSDNLGKDVMLPVEEEQEEPSKKRKKTKKSTKKV
jgi:hypothetical protein